MTSLPNMLVSVALAVTGVVAGGQVGGSQVPREDSLVETRDKPTDATGHGRQSTRTEVGEAGEVTCDDVAMGRSLDRYERLGPLEGPSWNDDYHLAVREARSFVWKHWRARQCGYLIITFSSIDERSSSHVFIEPDGRGEFRVSWRIVRLSDSIDDLPPMYSLKRFVLLEGGKTGEALSDEVDVDPSQYVLQLYERDGTLGQSL